MKDLLTSYSKYNHWANQRVCEFLFSLSDEELDKEIVSSFSSLRKTILHIWDAQVIWMVRLKGDSLSSFPSKSFSGTVKEAADGLLKTSQELIEFVESSSENFLETPLSYKNLSGEEFKSKVSDIVQHVMNHGTFHRGQIITMLRQLGYTRLFSTDYIAYCREVVETKN